MGDDLSFAKVFVEETTQTLQDFFNADERPDYDVLSAAMTRIQSGAKTLHARAIYQSAQSVLQAISATPQKQAKIDGRLLALNKLVFQYADGLAEIYASTEEVELEETESEEIESEEIIDETALDESPAEPVELTNTDSVEDGIDTSSDEQNFIAAKATLTELLPLAREPEKSNLIRLTTINERKEPDLPKHPLESVMRDVVQDALSIARMRAKTISISYDVGETELTEADLDQLQVRLSQSLRALIFETLPSTTVGHIDIEIAGDELCVKAQGPVPQFIPKPNRLSRDGDKVSLYLPLRQAITTHQNQPPKARRIKPMITDETEAEIRQQLAQLMEPAQPVLSADESVTSIDHSVLENITLTEARA